jgi:hypothetical protein
VVVLEWLKQDYIQRLQEVRGMRRQSEYVDPPLFTILNEFQREM